MQSATIIKYLISGSIAAAVNLLLLYFFTDMMHLWYILSACIAFVITFFVSFILQRSWTFKGTSTGLVRRQLLQYFAVAMFNILINAVLLYVLVEYLHLYYLVAQFITLAAISIESFFVYKKVIFVSRDAA